MRFYKIITILCTIVLSLQAYSQKKENRVSALFAAYKSLNKKDSKKTTFYTVESARFLSDTVALCTVSEQTITQSDLEYAVIYKLMEDQWQIQKGSWQLQHRKLLTEPVEGEMIASPEEPESEELQQVVARLKKAGTEEKERIWQSLNGKLPLIEDSKKKQGYKLVSFIWREEADNVRISLFGDLPFHPNGLDHPMVRVPGTDMWFQSLTVPADARTSYGFDIIRNYIAKGTQKTQSFITSVPDHRNPKLFGGASVLELPNAPVQPYITPSTGTAKGSLIIDSFKSKTLGETRRITVYTPVGYKATNRYPLLVLFDAAFYGAGKETVVPIPVILNNMIAAGVMQPIICVLVHQKKREQELAGNALFTQYLAEELMPYVRGKWSIADSSSKIATAGSSVGGFGAIYAAYKHPEIFGNAISQSGAFWLPKNVQDPVRREYIPPAIWFAQELIENPGKKIRIWMEVSKMESAAKMIGPNRQIRDILKLNGYDVLYQEFNGGHDYLHWRGSISDALVVIFGK